MQEQSGQVNKGGARYSQLLRRISKLPLLLTPLTAMDGGNAIELQGATLAHVGDADIGVFGRKISAHQ